MGLFDLPEPPESWNTDKPPLTDLERTARNFFALFALVVVIALALLWAVAQRR